MDEIPFVYRALSDLFIGTLIVAPLVYTIDSTIPLSVISPPLTLLGALQQIPLPIPVILFVIGLFWTLLTVLSGNVGMSWI
jgi:hypothetical protein